MSEDELETAHRLFNWFGVAVGQIGIERTRSMLQALLNTIEQKEKEKNENNSNIS
jgi:hypothetical protein